MCAKLKYKHNQQRHTCKAQHNTYSLKYSHTRARAYTWVGKENTSDFLPCYKKKSIKFIPLLLLAIIDVLPVYIDNRLWLPPNSLAFFLFRLMYSWMFFMCLPSFFCTILFMKSKFTFCWLPNFIIHLLI